MSKMKQKYIEQQEARFFDPVDSEFWENEHMIAARKTDDLIADIVSKLENLLATMRGKTLILAGTVLLSMGTANASIMSLTEAKDKLTVIQRHESVSKADYESAKHSYKQAKRARKCAQKEIHAIAKANAASVAAEQASIGYAERAHHYNAYLDEQYLGSGNLRITGGAE